MKTFDNNYTAPSLYIIDAVTGEQFLAASFAAVGSEDYFVGTEISL